MNFVIPMAGHGQRFIDAGYNKPKMLIKAHGKTLLEWSVNSLPIELCTNLVFIGLREHEDKYKISDFIKSRFKGSHKLNFLFLEEVTRGQSETVLRASSFLDYSKALLIFNIDTCFSSSTLKNKLQRNDVDGVLGSFHDCSSRFSFAKTNSKGFITEVKEKEPISYNALTGLYHFSKTEDFVSVANEAIIQNELIKNEYYVAPLYNKLISKGKKFILDRCKRHFILGTPEEFESFKNKYSVE